ncbi:MAG: TetR/AcrR family transcriptional regulator, partial [Aquabacterium sp.]
MEPIDVSIAGMADPHSSRTQGENAPPPTDSREPRAMPADPKTRRDAPRRGRPPKSVPQGTDLRCALVDAAALEIRESGYHATSSNRIAARAGLSAGAFYNYFQDKVDVL